MDVLVGRAISVDKAISAALPQSDAVHVALASTDVERAIGPLARRMSAVDIEAALGPAYALSAISGQMSRVLDALPQLDRYWFDACGRITSVDEATAALRSVVQAAEAAGFTDETEAELLAASDDATEEDRERISIDLEQISDALIALFAASPDQMRELSPRKFEELIAELFVRMGYDACLTPESNDGGYDILATRLEPHGGKVITLVECKRWALDNPVGVAIVRGLYGVVEQMRSNQGIIATTSRFTSGALEQQRMIGSRMSLNDYKAIADWCSRYRAR